MKGYIDSLNSPRFSGIKTFMRLPYVSSTSDLDAFVYGIPFDTGSSFGVGSRFGPQKIREASAILKPYNPILDIDVQDVLNIADVGDLLVVPGYIEKTYDSIEQELIPLIEKGSTPIALGGDHSITLAELRAIARKAGPVALVQFDSHSDTGDLYFGEKYNHGTTFRRAIEENLIIPDKSFQIGLRGPLYAKNQFDFAVKNGVEQWSNWRIRLEGFENLIDSLQRKLKDTPIFISFDIDFLDAAYAPGTGTPEICGFNTFEAQRLMLEGLRGLNIVGADLVEVLPAYDSPGQITAYAACGIIFDMISLIAFSKS